MMDDAAEILGLSPVRIRKLIKEGAIRTAGSSRAPLLAWDDVCRIAGAQRPPWALLTNELVHGSVSPEGLFLAKLESADTNTSFETNQVAKGHCIDWMKKMPAGSVQTVVTSPPYWGVRRYKGEQEVLWSDGTRCAFGAEDTPEAYVRHTMDILRHLKRVLRDDGVIWWNIGDSYQTRTHIREGSVERLHALDGRRQDGWKDYPHKRYSAGHDYLKDKDLTLVPFAVAMGAQHLGFWVRSVIIWSKENTLPEPVKDRPTTSHEYIFMLVKSRFYYYAHDVAKDQTRSTKWAPEDIDGQLKNWRTVWTFATAGSEDRNHTAAFPEELPKRCIVVSSRPNDLVFDPFAGSGTTLVVAKRLGRQYFGCDLSDEYVDEASARLERERGSLQATLEDALPPTELERVIDQESEAQPNREQLPLL